MICKVDNVEKKIDLLLMDSLEMVECAKEEFNRSIEVGDKYYRSGIRLVYMGFVGVVNAFYVRMSGRVYGVDESVDNLMYYIDRGYVEGEKEIDRHMWVNANFTKERWDDYIYLRNCWEGSLVYRFEGIDYEKLLQAYYRIYNEIKDVIKW